ncbi:carboxylating nicotinate-nucleotide diphosphorylase [Effusibacillus lacus]|uniref:Probable nicotinate-nucleotide pyrophosphorylase [carboxylating] n=1 Tax=Effusibacillus lacus TaxID=1348429 RepID=A0A292YIR0_9BACL|nr:carboxylating nicotinate-nucleotide diphosphorylase [Effusibacillus lacus]TCS74487.1 nicotinate-nucleotide pyrophosphorylase [carboxylating] [Effusibacillus lacus]GAX88643.1 nicotinate-nucleotide diphosphorylase [Effusibacillus lacus]
MKLDLRVIEPYIVRSLEEDIGFADITTDSIVPPDQRAKGVLYMREPGILAGIQVAEQVFKTLDSGLNVAARAKDGESVAAGQAILEISGSARSILTAERVALNFVQRLSGIATRTARFVELVRYYNAKIVDTRKTTPGLRLLEKYAVTVGGGRNHRFGLYDAVVIKENHIRLAGGIKQAIMTARHHIPHTTKVEVEVHSLEQIEEALEVKADIILLSNMGNEMLREAVDLVAGRAITEASGDVSEETVVDIAKTGVDYIAVGTVTSSARSLDISLELVNEG